MSDGRIIIHEALGARRAVVLSIHGLNQHADALTSLTSSLQAQGATIVSLRLTGHTRAVGEPTRADALAAWRSVQWTDWQNDWEVGAHVAADLAAQSGVPLNFLGYSLGSLVHIHQLAYSSAPIQFNAQVLLAPALRVQTYAHVVRLLQPLGTGFLIPTFVPEPIRSHPSTSVAAYTALFDLHDRLSRVANVEALRIPTLVAMDRADEVVSASAVERWVATHGLVPFWQFEWLAKDRETAVSRRAHYVTDPQALGIRAFQRLTARLCARLIPPSEPQKQATTTQARDSSGTAPL